MPRNLTSKPRGVGAALYIIQFLTMFGFFSVTWQYIKPAVFDPMGSIGGLYLLVFIGVGGVILLTLFWIVGNSAKREVYMASFLPLIPLQATNSTSTQNQALQVIEYFMANPFVIISLVVGILGGLVVLLDRLGLLKGFRKALDKTYEFEY